MCLIERKTYYHTNGREETIEKTRPCHRAVGNRLCKHVERRSFEAARIVETKPSSSSKSITSPEQDRDGYIVTEGSRGQQRMYRDLSKRSSNSTSSIRRSTTMSDRTTPVSTPSSASSPSYVEVKPEAPSPPPAALYGERTRAPYSSSKPRPSFTKDGTAIYERPQSTDQPRAVDNERPTSSRLSKESSFSSITAEVDDTIVPDHSHSRRRPDISIDTGAARPATPTSAHTSSPGLSTLKSAFRRDSGKDVPRKPSLRHRADSTRNRRRDDPDEDDRQARIERDRLAGTDRRHSARDKLARDASRDRHRREAAERLEGGARSLPRDDVSVVDDDDPTIQLGRDAERAEMERERERAAHLRRGEEWGQRYVDADQQRRRADADERYRRPQPQPQITSSSSYSASHQRPSSSSSASPVSTRSPVITSARAFNNTTTTTAMQPRIHQQPPPATTTMAQGQSIAQRGEDVIARERARAAGRELNEAVGGMSLREREAEEYQARRSGERGYGGGGSGGGGRRYR